MGLTSALTRVWAWIARRLRGDARPIREGAVASGRVRARAYDVALCRYRVPWWDTLSKAEKVQELRGMDPVQEVVDTNTTCVGLDELRVDNLDENQAVNEKLTECDFGTDDTTPAYSNRSLNSQVYRADVASTDDQGTDLALTVSLDTNEANGNDLKELGLISEGDRLVNHSTFTTVSKTSSIIVNFDITLIFSNA